MADINEQLGIDTDIVEWELLSSSGTAEAYRKRATQDSSSTQNDHLISATNYRVAGANSLLLGKIYDARKFFHNSASEYLAAGSLYGLLIDNLGYGANIKIYSTIENAQEGTDVFSLWPIISNSPKYADNRKIQINLSAWNESITNLRNESIGLLGLPVSVYLNLFRALISIRNTGNEATDLEVYREMIAALFPFANAYSAGLDRARSDEYHWSQLAMPFHPIEPEIMSVLIGAKQALSGNNIIERLMLSMPIGELPQFLIEYVFNQYSKSDEKYSG